MLLNGQSAKSSFQIAERFATMPLKGTGYHSLLPLKGQVSFVVIRVASR